MMTRMAAIAGSVSILGLLGGLWYVTAGQGAKDAFAACRQGAVAGEIGGPFELVNGAGQTVTDTDVITEASLIYFGYTFCPDICPYDTARNADAIDILAEHGVSATPIFITVDPKRDTVEAVNDFAANLHDKMIGLTGTEEQVRAASKAYRTYYKAQPAEDEYYLVDHSTFTYLVFPDTGFADYFRRDMTAEQMAERVACFDKARA